MSIDDQLSEVLGRFASKTGEAVDWAQTNALPQLCEVKVLHNYIEAGVCALAAVIGIITCICMLVRARNSDNGSWEEWDYKDAAIILAIIAAAFIVGSAYFFLQGYEWANFTDAKLFEYIV